MAFILDSQTSLKVADLILEVFIAVKEKEYLPQLQNNKVALLERRVDNLETQMQGKMVNNFHAPVTLIQGDHNQVKVGVRGELILSILEIMKDHEVVMNQELTTLLSKSIELANKSDKKGLLSNLKSVADIGSKVVSVVKNIPHLIKIVESIF